MHAFLYFPGTLFDMGSHIDCSFRNASSSAAVRRTPSGGGYGVGAHQRDARGTRQSREQKCEGHGYSQAECVSLGCCDWEPATQPGQGNCWADVGTCATLTNTTNTTTNNTNTSSANNDDGTLSMAEAKAQGLEEATFNELDADGNGQLTYEELRVALSTAPPPPVTPPPPRCGCMFCSYPYIPCYVVDDDEAGVAGVLCGSYRADSCSECTDMIY